VRSGAWIERRFDLDDGANEVGTDALLAGAGVDDVVPLAAADALGAAARGLNRSRDLGTARARNLASVLERCSIAETGAA